MTLQFEITAAADQLAYWQAVDGPVWREISSRASASDVADLPQGTSQPMTAA
jgi:hypothetical protein